MPAQRVILLVEDQFLVLMMLRDVFADAGFETLEAANAADAVALLSARSDIAAVISDIEMPGKMNGIDLAWHIDRAFPDKVVILMSGRTQPSPDELPSGVSFCMKPLGLDDLIAEVGMKLSKAAADWGFASVPDLTPSFANVRPKKG